MRSRTCHLTAHAELAVAARKEGQRSRAPPQDDTAHGDIVPATALQVSAAEQAPETRSKRGAKGRVQWAVGGGEDVAAAPQSANGPSGSR